MRKAGGAKSKTGGGGMTFFPPSSSSSSLLQNYQHQHGEDEENEENGYGDEYQDEDQVNHNLTVGLFNQMKLSPPKAQSGHTTEENDMIRGYGLNSANYYDQNQPGFPVREYLDGEEEFDEEDYEGGDVEDADEMLMDDKPPEMPQQFYEEVDSFLKKPPPSFRDVGSNPAAKPKKSKGKVETTPSGPNGPVKKSGPKGGLQKQGVGIADAMNEMLPPIAPQVSSKGGYSNNSYPPNHTLDDAQIGEEVAEKKKRKKVGSKLPQRGQTKNELDHSLLHEAFAYTDKLLRDAVMEEQFQQALQEDTSVKKGHPRSAPADLEHEARGAAAGIAAYAASSGNNSQGKKKSNGGINAVRNLKKQGGGSGGGGNSKRGDFNVGGDNNESDMRRNPLNFDELVSNFQNGTTLEKLRRELTESRNSLAQSESVIRELSGQYLQPKHSKHR